MLGSLWAVLDVVIHAFVARDHGETIQLLELYMNNK